MRSRLLILPDLDELGVLFLIQQLPGRAILVNPMNADQPP